MAVLVERRLKHVFQRFRIGDFLQAVHALVIVKSIFLHADHRRIAGLTFLCTQHLLRILQRGFHHGNHVKRITFRFRIKQFQRSQQERAQRLVKREIIRHVDGHEIVLAAIIAVFRFDHIRIEQGLEDLVGTIMKTPLLFWSLRRIVDQAIDAVACVAALRHFVQHHGMRDLHMWHQSLRVRVDQPVERVLIPRDEALRCFLALDFLELLGVVACLGEGLGVLDFEFRPFGDNQTFRVEAHTSRTPCDLMEFAGAQFAHFRAVELGQCGQHHGMDGHVDADTQRVGAADYRQQTLLGELLDQTTIAGEHARMVNADSGAQQTLQNLAECGGELRTFDRLRNGGTLFLAGHTRACQGVRRLQCGVLGEMHHINRCFVSAERQFDGFLQRVKRVLVCQRYRTRRIGDDVDVRVRHVLQFVGDRIDVAQCGAHQQKLRVRQCQQRNLPSPTTLRIAIIMEFIHRHTADIGMTAFTQCLVRENLRSAADDRSVGVDVCVSGDHADVLAAEHLHQIKELLRHQRFNRSCVIRATARAQRSEMHTQRHQ